MTRASTPEEQAAAFKAHYAERDKQDMSPKINCGKELELFPIEKIVPNAKNPNHHSDEQIDRLCKIIEYQGFRDPLIISNLSGTLISGHGRLLAAKKLGMKEVPVLFQDFADEDMEYAATVSENSIASWADLDLSMINLRIGEFSPDFDLQLLGIKGFGLDPRFEPGTEDEQGKLDEKAPIECPKCGHMFVKT